MTTVQTDLDPDEFKAFEEICRREQISKRDAIRCAILDWIKKKNGFNPNDPLFSVEPSSADIHPGSNHVDELVYKRRTNGE